MAGPSNCAHPWAKPCAQVQKELGVDLKRGLSTAEVDERRKHFGYNELAKEPPTPLWKLVAEQFDDTLVKVWRSGPWNSTTIYEMTIDSPRSPNSSDPAGIGRGFVRPCIL